MFFCDCASRSNTDLDSVSSTLRYCMTAPRANLGIVRLVARIRRLSSQRLCKNKIFGKVSATHLLAVTWPKNVARHGLCHEIHLRP